MIDPATITTTTIGTVTRVEVNGLANYGVISPHPHDPDRFRWSTYSGQSGDADTVEQAVAATAETLTVTGESKRHPNLQQVVDALTADPAYLIEWAAMTIVALGAKAEWSMEDNFQTTEELAGDITSWYDLPGAGDQSEEALQFYGEAAVALGFPADIEKGDDACALCGRGVAESDCETHGTCCDSCHGTDEEDVHDKVGRSAGFRSWRRTNSGTVADYMAERGITA